MSLGFFETMILTETLLPKFLRFTRARDSGASSLIWKSTIPGTSVASRTFDNKRCLLWKSTVLERIQGAKEGCSEVQRSLSRALVVERFFISVMWIRQKSCCVICFNNLQVALVLESALGSSIIKDMMMFINSEGSSRMYAGWAVDSSSGL